MNRRHSFTRNDSQDLAMPVELHGQGRFVLLGKDFESGYLRLHAAGELQARAKTALEGLRSCRVCPHECGVNRWEDQVGRCRSGRAARVTSAFAHYGEEDCLRGWRGSGTIFFSWCNLGCVFCQNHDISQRGEGEDVTASELAGLMLSLQTAGCHNINLVTPEHVVPQILEALVLAVEKGLTLPLVYNTSAYDSVQSLDLMEGVVDVYMPDFKFWDRERSGKYLRAPDYPEAAREGIKRMHRQVGDLRVDENGVALRGVLVRHLVMPGMLDETRAIMRFLANELSRDTFVNVMDQYHPAWKVVTDRRYAEINRPLTGEEYAGALDAARAAGLWRFDTRWRPRGGWMGL